MYTALLLLIHIDYRIYGIGLSHLFVAFYLLKSMPFKINFDLFALCIFLLPYLLISLYLNTFDYPNYSSIELSTIRPLFIYMNIIFQFLFLTLFYKKLANQSLNTGAISIFYFVLLFFYCIDWLDYSFTKNESGLFANIALVSLLLVLRQYELNPLKLCLQIFTLIITKSSINFLLPILLIEKNIRRVISRKIILILSISVLIYFLPELMPKLRMLLSPRIEDSYSGRYWANKQLFEMFLESPIIGYGIDSLNFYRKLKYESDIFDHGGSDILYLISSFGIFGVFFIGRILFLFYRDYLSSFYKLDLLGLFVALALLIKGIGFFSSFGSIFMIFFLIMKSKKLSGSEMHP